MFDGVVWLSLLCDVLDYIKWRRVFNFAVKSEGTNSMEDYSWQGFTENLVYTEYLKFDNYYRKNSINSCYKDFFFVEKIMVLTFHISNKRGEKSQWFSAKNATQKFYNNSKKNIKNSQNYSVFPRFLAENCLFIIIYLDRFHIDYLSESKNRKNTANT